MGNSGSGLGRPAANAPYQCPQFPHEYLVRPPFRDDVVRRQHEHVVEVIEFEQGGPEQRSAGQVERTAGLLSDEPGDALLRRP